MCTCMNKMVTNDSRDCLFGLTHCEITWSRTYEWWMICAFMRERYDSFICVIGLIGMCDMTDSHEWLMCDMTDSHLWLMQQSPQRSAPSHVWAITHSYAWQDLLKYVSHDSFTFVTHVAITPTICSFKCVSDDSSICVTGLIHMHDRTRWYVSHD